METLEEICVTAVGDESLQAMEESGKNKSPVNYNLCFVLQAFVSEIRLYNISSELFVSKSLL